MQNKISPSTIVRKALGMEELGSPVQQETECCMCGRHLRIGDLAFRAAFSSGFTDDIDLAKRGTPNPMTCGDCMPLTTIEGLRNSGFGAFNLEGAKPFRKWVDVATALLNPPAPPFVLCYSTAKSQHMAWRSPVNYSTEMFYVRVGLRDLLVRRKRLIDAPAICARMATAIYGEQSDKKRAATKTLPHPFKSLSPDLKDLEHGRLNPRVYALEMKTEPPYPEFHEDLNWLRSLTPGETWALRFTLTPGAGQGSVPQ